jgi:hypothetical protein
LKISSEKLDDDDDVHDDFMVKSIENPVVNPDISSNQQPALSERTKEKVYLQLNRLKSSYNPEASTLTRILNKEGRFCWIKLLLPCSTTLPTN